MVDHRASLGVLVITKNEELNLAPALRSVSWADEIKVIDSESTDRTREIAEAAGAEVTVRPFTDYSDQRNFALDELKWSSDWILVLDADERVTPTLRRSIEEVLASDSVASAGFEIDRDVVWQGKVLEHCGWSPSWPLRLFRYGHGRYEDRPVGEHVVVDGKVGRLEGAIFHDDGGTIDTWVAKHLRYQQLEAEARAFMPRSNVGAGRHLETRLRRTLKNGMWRRTPRLLRPALLFLYMFVIRLGFLDGARGFQFCVLHAWNEWMIGVREKALLKKTKTVRGIGGTRG